MLVQRAAARLPLRLDHGVPVRLERAPGGVVDVGEERVHDAALEEGRRWPGEDGRGRERVGRAFSRSSLLCPPALSGCEAASIPIPNPIRPAPASARGEAGGAEGARQGEERPPELLAREDAEDEPRDGGEPTGTEEQVASGLEPAAVSDP